MGPITAPDGYTYGDTDGDDWWKAECQHTTPAEAVKENEVAATCTTAGSYDSVVYCSVCKTELSRETKVLDLAAHTEGAVVVENEKAATCTAEGSYDNVVYCTVCNAELSRNTVTVEKIAHAYEAVVTAPTCTAKGYTTYTCSACGDSYVADETEMVAHTEEIIPGKDATCTETGLTEGKKCTVCGETTVAQEEIPATGHVNTTTTTVDATCTTAGSVTVTCSCGEVVSTETIKATGVHNYVDGVCSGCEKEEPIVKLLAIEVSYDAELLLGLKFTIPDELIEDPNAYVEVYLDGRTQKTTVITMPELKAQGTDSKGRYVIEQGLASPEMGAPVTMKFVDGTGRVVTVNDYVDQQNKSEVSRTVVDYARLVFEKGTKKQKDMATALLVYGGYAQKFFNYDANNPVYNVLTEYGISLPDLGEITADTITQELKKSGASIGLEQTKQQAFLASSIYHEVYVTMDEGRTVGEYSFVLTYVKRENGVQVEDTMELTPVYDAEKKRYTLTIPKVASPNLDYMYTIQMTEIETGNTYEVETSVMAYVKLGLQNSTNTNQINFFKAIYLYSEAASEFFGM
jgi:hypothetical protein